MEREPFKTPATLTSLKSRVDRSYVVTFSTQELSPLEVAELSQYLQYYGTLAFAAGETNLDALDKLEIPDEIVEVGQKSKSQRLRNVLILLAKQKNEDPDLFYAQQMERIINAYKLKLPPLE